MKNTAEHEIAQMEINKAKRLKQLWQIVLDKNTKPRDKSRALNLIRNEEEFTVKRRQIIGLMPADKQEIEHVGTPLQEGITINIIKPENGPDNMETDSKTVPSSGNPERQNND